MSARDHWIARIQAAWKEKPIVWLMGVRRAGKTTLLRSIEGLEYLDCESPRVRRLFEDPEAVFPKDRAAVIGIDEIHRLPNPSEVLKIAHDHFPQIRIIATGSSTLSAGAKFKDTLTDRKRVVWLTPANHLDQAVFGLGLKDRLLKGGLPPAFLGTGFNEAFYQDWIDSFWAKDIQELFRVEKRSSFLKFTELLALQSGGLFQASSFAAGCEASRTSIQNYLNILEIANVAIVLRPFQKRAPNELLAIPKVYFFDTGFVSFFNGATEIHENEKGRYWEHYVLNELLSTFRREDIHYWRTKQRHEIDFVIQRRGKPPIAIEVKWKADGFKPEALFEFRRLHPGGDNYVVCTDVDRKIERDFDSHRVRFIPISEVGGLDQVL